MYKNLCAEALGVTGRQSELIELALTYGFRGIDINFSQFAKQAKTRGLDHAARFLKSSSLSIGACELPVQFEVEDAAFNQSLDDLAAGLESARTIGATTFYVTVAPASDSRPYHENFDLHRARISQLAERLAVNEDTRLGLAFVAPAVHREARQFQFISSPDALMALMKTTVADNLGLVVDLWHWRVGGGSFEQLRELSPDQILMVRAADLPADVSLESISDDQRLMPGSTDSPETLQAVKILKEMNYDGPVTPYPHASQQATGRTRDQIVQKASDAIDKLLRDAEQVDSPSDLTAAVG